MVASVNIFSVLSNTAVFLLMSFAKLYILDISEECGEEFYKMWQLNWPVIYMYIFTDHRMVRCKNMFF